LLVGTLKTTGTGAVFGGGGGEVSKPPRKES
jgi:hypothetical protein